MDDRQLRISQAWLGEIAAYLAERPWREVNHLIGYLQQAEPLETDTPTDSEEEDNAEEEEGAVSDNGQVRDTVVRPAP